MAGADNSSKDLLHRPIGALIGWGLPLLAVFLMNFAHDALPAGAIILALSGALAWMGVACVANALRCGRLHCYLSGPVFLIGAALILVAGFRLAPLGPIGVSHITFAIIGLVVASFALEWILGAYAQWPRRSASRENR